jgi:hypothetical protein
MLMQLACECNMVKQFLFHVDFLRAIFDINYV